MPRHHHRGLRYFLSTFAIVIGVVLVWHGAWYGLEWLDRTFLGGPNVATIVGSIIIGFLILYIPDRDLSELRKL